MMYESQRTGFKEGSRKSRKRSALNRERSIQSVRLVMMVRVSWCREMEQMMDDSERLSLNNILRLMHTNRGLR